MSRAVAFAPLSPDAVTTRLVDLLTRRRDLRRVAVDGPPCTEPRRLVDGLIEPLRARGRPAVHVQAETFWRDASLRFEYGHEDLESYRTWLDADALRREVLDALVVDGTYLPSLRDPRTNRSTREPSVATTPDTVVLVSGAFLLGRDLPFDHRVHLTMSPAARSRRTPPAEAWTLPAYLDYDNEVQPIGLADVVIKLDDPAHPAVRGL